MTIQWAIFLLLAGAATNVEKPLLLVTRSDAESIHIEVEGQSSSDCALEYELHVESGSDGNINQSVQRGRARLSPGRHIVVARTVLRIKPAEEWTARLTVQSCDGVQYELHRTGAA